MIDLHPVEGPHMVLHLSPRDEGLAVAVTESPVGTAAAETLVLQRLDDVLRMVSQPTFHEDIGRGLFRALLPGPLGDLYRAAFTAATITGQNLTLILHFDPALINIASYPWELLHDGTRFVLQAGAVNLVRRFPAPVHPQPTTPRSPQEVLAVIATPTDFSPALRPKPAYVDLYSTLEHALEPQFDAEEADLAILMPPTWHALREWALAGAPDVLHFVGYGAYARTGQLVFENDRQRGDPVGADTFGALLLGSRLKLVVLMGSESAQEAHDPLLGSIAPALILAGVPAVVALPHALPREAMLRFVEAFYTALTTGQTLELALAEARKTLVRTTLWHIPTLTRRAPVPVETGSQRPCQIDTVAPQIAPVNQTFRMGVWLQPPDAQAPDAETIQRLLGYDTGGDPSEPLPRVPTPITRTPRDTFPTGPLQVQVSAEQCAIHGDHAWTIMLDPDLAPPPLWFALTPRASGPVAVQITVLHAGEPLITVTHPVQIAPTATHDLIPEVRTHIAAPAPQAAPPSPTAPIDFAAEPEPTVSAPTAAPSDLDSLLAEAHTAPQYDVLDLLRDADLLDDAPPRARSALDPARESSEHAAVQDDLAQLQATLDAENAAAPDLTPEITHSITTGITDYDLDTVDPALTAPEMRARRMALLMLAGCLLLIGLAVALTIIGEMG